MQRRSRTIAKRWNLARMSRIRLECAAIFLHLPLTVRCRPGDYTRAMMNKRILTICAAVAAGAAATSLALAQGYTVPPGAVYSTAPQPFPPGGYGYPADYRRAPGAPDFDALDDDEAPNAQSSTALPPPGPVLSPNDPRYGRPMGAPVYSDRGPPPFIYSARPPYPNDDRAMRPPEAVGGTPGITGALQQQPQQQPAMGA